MMGRALAVLAVLLGAAGAVVGTTGAARRSLDRTEAREILLRMKTAEFPPFEARFEIEASLGSSWFGPPDRRGEPFEAVAVVRQAGPDRWAIELERSGRGHPGAERGHRRPGWGGREHGRRPAPFEIQDVDLAVANYAPRVETDRPFLGRRTIRVSLAAPEGDRPARDYRVDETTGFVLEAAERDLSGETVARFRIVAFRWLSPEEAEAIPARERPEPGRERGSRSRFERRDLGLEDLPREAGIPVYVPAELPRGFRFERAHVRPGPGRPHVMISYTDGLARIRLLEGPREVDWAGYLERLVAEGHEPQTAARLVEAWRARWRGFERLPGRPECQVVSRSRAGPVPSVATELGDVRVDVFGPIPTLQLVKLITNLELIEDREH